MGREGGPRAVTLLLHGQFILVGRKNAPDRFASLVRLTVRLKLMGRIRCWLPP
jgi:hypothetical protein